MTIKKCDVIWLNGEFLPWDEAKIHVLSHALHYGSGVFEGIRFYTTPRGSAIFRGRDHYKRLFQSAQYYYIKIKYSPTQLLEATKELVKRNKLSEGYIRPIAYFGYGQMGLNPLQNPVDVAIACWEWGAYLGEEGLAKGIRCCISSWIRIDSRIVPPLAKACGNYLNSILAKLEAKRNGYDEAIMLNMNGNVSEGSGENIFIVKDGVLITPPLSAGCLNGITRDSCIKLARKMGIDVREETVTRDMLLSADEAFLTGTAAEVTPIKTIDNVDLPEAPGQITKKIQSTFFDTVRGRNPDFIQWLDFI